MDPTKRFIRKTRVHRTACLVYIVSAIVLMTINCWFSAAVKNLSMVQLFFNFVVPFFIFSPLYGLVWRRSLVSRLLLNHLPSVKTYILFIPAVASFLIILFSENQSTNLITSLLSILSMALTPYVLVSKQKSAIAIVAEGVWFLLLASNIGNAEAVAGIYCTTILLLFALDKLSWYYSSERHVYAATRLAVISFCLIIAVIVSIDNNPIINTLVTSYFTTPISNAVPNLIDRASWDVIIPIITLNLSGIYISHKSNGIQHYLTVCFASLIFVYSTGYMLNCFCWKLLCFNDIAPFISGGFAQNLIFLVASALVLPPKQANVISRKDDNCTPSDFSKDDVESAVQEVINAVHSN